MLERYQPAGPFFKKDVDEVIKCGKMIIVR